MTAKKRPRPKPGSSHSVVAADAFVAFVAFLGLDRHGRDRARLEPGERDRFAGHFAKAILAAVDAAQRRVDLGDELALAIAGPELDRPVGFRRGAVGEIRLADRPALQLSHRALRFAEDLVLPSEQLLPEIGALRRVHELFIRARPISRAVDMMVVNPRGCRSHNPSAPNADRTSGPYVRKPPPSRPGRSA